MINYINGDATFPEKITPDKINIIVHCCNNIGVWGAGFVLALSRRWKSPERDYRTYYKSMNLGDIRLVKVENNAFVCNLIGQYGIIPSKTTFNWLNNRNSSQMHDSSSIPLRYEALESGFCKLKNVITKVMQINEVAIHMSKIGCGLAGGNWEKVEKIINKVFENFNVYVYC